ncbi:hypothetical protein [Deinococcus petrolearius]|uniref:Secreted protein with PEP-CTERM sorting signal n=1 Tax=Deinococcus petrolearius TaxID=1751295 RepID=A0ABW1DH55_9DEIO
MTPRPGTISLLLALVLTILATGDRVVGVDPLPLLPLGLAAGLGVVAWVRGARG